jgi:hypothetical protein
MSCVTCTGYRSLTEYAASPTEVVDGVPLRFLPLERIIASKRAANRLKDRAQLPALEATLAAMCSRDPSKA